MGITLSCLSGGPGVLRRLVENGDCGAVLDCVRDNPGLLVAPCFPGKNTLLHVVSRYGQTAILTALLQLVDELSLAGDDLQHPSDSYCTDHDRHTLDSALSHELITSAQGPHHAGRSKVQSLTTGSHKGRSRSVSVVSAGARCGPDMTQLEVVPTKRRLVNMLNALKQGPLIVAASRGHADMVSILLQLGADPNVVDKDDGCIALHYTAMYGHLECARCLLVSAASSQQGVAGGGAGGGGGGSITQQAVATRSITLSRTQGANDSSGNNSYTTAPQTPPSTQQRPARAAVQRMVNLASKAGATALHFAADAGHAEMVRLLCANGADINAVMRPDRFRWLMLHHGATPLHLAAEQGHLAVALVLLRHYQDNYTTLTGLQDPRNATDRAGLRPHQLAFLTHHFRVALVIRPGYPLRWLFDNTAAKTAIPSLASLAAAVLRKQLCSEIDSLEQASQPPEPVVSVIKPLPIMGSGRHSSSIRSSAMGLGMGMGLESTMNTPRQGWTQAEPLAGAGAGGAPAGAAVLVAAGQDDTVFRIPAALPGSADLQSIREAAGLAGAGGVAGAGQAEAAADRRSQQAVPPLRLATALALQQRRSAPDPTAEIHTARGVELQVIEEDRDAVGAGQRSPTCDSPCLVQDMNPGRVEETSPIPWGGQGVQGSGRLRAQGLKAGHVSQSEDEEEEEEEDICDVCFEGGTRLRLRPCCHEVCLRCARKISNAMVSQPATCPFCRGCIAGFKAVGAGAVIRPGAAAMATAPNSLGAC